jgi:hypothetical protein
LALVGALAALVSGLGAIPAPQASAFGFLSGAHSIHTKVRTAITGGREVPGDHPGRKRQHRRHPSQATDQGPASAGGGAAAGDPGSGASATTPAAGGEGNHVSADPGAEGVGAASTDDQESTGPSPPEAPELEPTEPAPPSQPPTPPVQEPEPEPPVQQPEPPVQQPEPEPPVQEPEPPAQSPEPPASPESNPEPAETPALFDGRTIRDFALTQAAPGAVTEVPDPAGSGETVLRLTVHDGDVAPVTPTKNPRAQLLSPDLIAPGDEFWAKTKFLIPQDFPTVTGWMSLLSVYGAPFDGSSPWQLELIGDHLQWMRNRTYDFDVPWQAPLQKGAWVSILLHERFARDGFIEMWVNGQPVSFFGRETKIEMQTMDSSNEGGLNAVKIEQYREAGMFDVGSVYFGPLSVGSTRQSVGG